MSKDIDVFWRHTHTQTFFTFRERERAHTLTLWFSCVVVRESFSGVKSLFYVLIQVRSSSLEASAFPLSCRPYVRPFLFIQFLIFQKVSIGYCEFNSFLHIFPITRLGRKKWVKVSFDQLNLRIFLSSKAKPLYFLSLDLGEIKSACFKSVF